MATVPEETYDRIANILRAYRRTDAELEEIKTILGELEQDPIQELLTRKREDHHMRPTNLLCMARDPESISVLLDSITDKTKRLDMLLVQDTIGSPLPSSLFHKYSAGYSFHDLTFLNFVRSIVERLSQAGVRKFLTTTYNEHDGGGLRKVLKSRTPDSKEIDKYINCIKFILDAINPEERLALLQSDGSRLSPVHCVLGQNPQIPSYERCLLQLILDCFPSENQRERVQLLKTTDEMCCGRSLFWKIQMYADDDLKLSVFKALEDGDLIDMISMRDRKGQICLFFARGREVLMKNIIRRGLGHSTMLEILQFQDLSNGQNVMYALSSHLTQSRNATEVGTLEFFKTTMNTITKPDIVDLLLTQDWTGSTAFDVALHRPGMLSWVIETVDTIELRNMITSRKALFSLTRSNEAVEMLLGGFSDEEKVEILKETDKADNNPLHVYLDMKLIKDVLNLIQVGNRQQLLQAQNCNSDTPLHRCKFEPQTFVEIFRGLPTQQAVEILAMQNNLGNTIVHNQSQQDIVRVITELTIDEPEQFLGIQNGENRTVFHNIVRKEPKTDPQSEMFVKMGMHKELNPPYISTLLKCVKKEPERYRILSLKDKQGQTVLHVLLNTNLTMEAMVELLEDSLVNGEHWYNLMSIADLKGNTPIHMMSDCPTLLGKVLMKMTANDMLKLLRLQNDNEDTVLHIAAYNRASAKTVDYILSLLRDRPTDQVELLKIENHKSLTAIQIAVETGNFSCKEYIVSRVGLETIFRIQFDFIQWTKYVEAIKKQDKDGLSKMLQEENLETLWFMQQLMANAGGELDHQCLRDVIEELGEEEINRVKKYIDSNTYQLLKTGFRGLMKQKKSGDIIEQVMLSALTTRFKNGGSILHMLSERKCTELLRKLLQAMSGEQRNALLTLANNNGKTALDLARSYEIRKLLEWSSVQRGFYYLPSPPHIIVMYITKNRDNKNRWEQEYLDLRKALDLFDATVIYNKDPGGDEMLNIVAETARKEMSALVVIIMSHGMLGQVRGADDKDIKIEKILKNMCSTTMVGKPKVLLVQACQNRVESLQPNETGTFNMPSSDMMAMMASVGGQAAHGNLMIPMFADELRKAPEDEDIYDTFLSTHQRMLEELREEDKGQQTPEFRSTLTHKLRLRRKTTTETYNDDEMDSGEDTSKDEYQKGIEKSAAFEGLAVTADLEKTLQEREDLLSQFVKTMKAECGDSKLAPCYRAIVAEAERLDVKDKAVLILAEILLTAEIFRDLKEHRNLFLSFTSGNDKAQRYLLGAFERLVGVKYHDKLISKTRPILKVIFDLDLVDEETLLEWSKKVSEKYVSKEVGQEIHSKAEPFIRWLKEAEEESEDEEESEEESEDGEVEVVFSHSEKVGLQEKPSVTDGTSATAKQQEDEEDDDIDIDDI